MIIGIGTDIVDIGRIKDLYEKSGQKFLDRILTKEEQKQATQVKEKSDDRFDDFLAKRFAAKEAVAKALGTGIGKSIKFTDVSVNNDKNGKPLITLSGNAEKTIQSLTPDNLLYKIDLSLSDEPPMAIAMVVISAY